MTERRYGLRNDMAEDLTRCIREIWRGTALGNQCSRKRGYGPCGLYCKQHANQWANRWRRHVKREKAKQRTEATGHD